MAQQTQETPKKKVYVKPSLVKREQRTEVTEACAFAALVKELCGRHVLVVAGSPPDGLTRRTPRRVPIPNKRNRIFIGFMPAF